MSSPSRLRPASPPTPIVPSAMRTSESSAAWRGATVASRAELEQLLMDDAPHGDLTTDAVSIGNAPGLMQFTARDRMALALAEDAAAIIELAGCQVELSA